MTVHERPIRTELSDDGSLVAIELNRPRGNVIDSEMIAAIRAEVRALGESAKARTVLFHGAGGEFSFGASVEEHRPELVGDFLPAFHEMFRELAASGKVLLAAVTGRCLGGGLELAAFCQRVFASRDAVLGCPETKLGVFAPIASVVLPRRTGQPVADELLISGRTLDASEALALWIVDEVVDDPLAAARSWHDEHIAPKSAVAVAHAVRASRHRLHRDLDLVLPDLERQYLEELMSARDPAEGIAAFLEKRKPSWKHE